MLYLIVDDETSTFVEMWGLKRKNLGIDSICKDTQGDKELPWLIHTLKELSNVTIPV